MSRKQRSQAHDFTGKVFGALVVIRRGEDYVGPRGGRRPRWTVQCIHTARKHTHQPREMVRVPGRVKGRLVTVLRWEDSGPPVEVYGHDPEYWPDAQWDVLAQDLKAGKTRSCMGPGDGVCDPYDPVDPADQEAVRAILAAAEQA